MCKKATCDTCGKRSWWGCGYHIPSVMDSVPEEERCKCEPAVQVEGKDYPPKASKPDELCVIL
ncbi:unnamed protein product [Umbelopsis ramanniana]